MKFRGSKKKSKNLDAKARALSFNGESESCCDGGADFEGQGNLGEGGFYKPRSSSEMFACEFDEQWSDDVFHVSL